MALMHSTRTEALAMLVALLLPAPAVMAETAPPDRSKTAGPISAELAKKLSRAGDQGPPDGAGGKQSLCSGAAGLFPRLHCQRRQHAG